MKQEPKTLSVPVAGRLYFDLGKNASYEAVRRGDIPVIRIGSRLRVPRIALEKMLEQAGSPMAPDDAGLPPTVSGPRREDGMYRKPNHPPPLLSRKDPRFNSDHHRAHNKIDQKSSARERPPQASEGLLGETSENGGAA